MIIDNIKADRINAMKNKDSVKSSLLSVIIGGAENEAKNKKSEITDEIILSIIKKMTKNTEITIDMVNKTFGDTTREVKNLEILKSYLPQEMSYEETEVIVNNILVDLKIKDLSDLGKLMKEIKMNYKNIDMQKVSEIAKKLL